MDFSSYTALVIMYLAFSPDLVLVATKMLEFYKQYYSDLKLILSDIVNQGNID